MLLCQFFCFWREIGFGVTYLFMQSKNSGGVVLVLWFWQEIVFDVTYVLSVQYSCAVVSVFWLWRKIVLKMRTPLISYEQFLQKKLIGLLCYDPLAGVCIS